MVASGPGMTEKRSGMIRVALAAEAGWSNSGDDLMLRGTAAALRDLDPTISLTVISPNVWQVREFMPPDVLCVESPLLTLDGVGQWVGPRMTRLRRRLVERRLRLGFEPGDGADPVRQSVEAIRGSDALVFAGGGYLTDRWPLTVRNARFLGETATRLGRPYVVFGHSVGPLRERGPRSDVAALLRGAAGVAPREPESATEVAALLGGGRWEPIGDPALLLPEVTAPSVPADRVVVNLRDHAPDDRELRPAVAAAVDAVATACGLALAFVEAGRAPYYDDAGAHRELDALVSPRVPRVEPCPQVPGRIDLPPARLVLAVSYHVCLLALARGVPTVGLAIRPYVAHKLRGLFRLFGRPDWVWSPDGASGDLTGIATDAMDTAGPDQLRFTAEELAARQRRWLADLALAPGPVRS
jgi:polysaccharide pyruvyl transferase WcaK-like protein